MRWKNGRVVDPAEELELAIALAVRAHHGQRYPSPETEPYILHALRVMLGVSGVRARAVAVLHDVLEDTAITAEELREANLSSEVVNAVTALTRRSGHNRRPPSPAASHALCLGFGVDLASASSPMRQSQ